MQTYFEPVKLFNYKVDNPGSTKMIPRISVDMGLGTFLAFVMNEAYQFGIKWGPEKRAWKAEIDRVVSLLAAAKEMTAALDSSYCMVDFFEESPMLHDLGLGLRATSYNPSFWEDMIGLIQQNYAPLEDQK